jgi:membrane associated rhomboid family serine protease
MRIFGSVGLMVTGFILLVVGFFVPFLMMIKVLEPTFLLILFGYMASVGGLIMGVVGSALFVRERQD